MWDVGRVWKRVGGGGKGMKGGEDMKASWV